ncbi:recQ-mediated genome instability protein 1-like [Leguminivora glycinivorella]|uniref:recQ-mediated genome instability protein 1-like n=1 Tax=Leguminivora glycinivorella TaxID=1035111 RepID=UPI00200CD6E5|nr:recQ-mediated genome instability protein 1-like [Leguminivora glycinivorella]
MSSVNLVNSVRNFLASNFMRVEDEWLTGCVEYLTEDSSNSYSESDIQNLAKEQWLLNDLKEICPGSLPANLRGQQKTVLNGRFALQINAAVDIGTPAYQQYMKLQKVNTENLEATTKFEDKVPSHRMIKLYLTDGVQEISAIEYKPMRNLSCDITPGCKVLVKGPIECRRGVLLLTESSIDLLGGEVQEIAVSNSLAGLLSSKLGLPMTQGTAADLNTTVPRHADIPPPHCDMPPARNPAPPTFDAPRPVAIVTSVQQANFADDDIDIDQLAAIEAQLTNKRASTDDRSKPEKKPKIDVANRIDDYPDDNDLFAEDEDYLRELESKFDATDPISVSSEPFTYLKQINEMREIEKAGRVFRVKAQIMKLLSKLSVGKEGWSLKCTIVDGTGSLDVDFTNNVLSKLVGYTPQEMNQLKKQMATDPQLKQKAVMALQKAKEALQVLYCIIELTMLEVPKITCLTPFDGSHLDLLKKRKTNL